LTAVLNESGRLIHQSKLATRAAAILDFVAENPDTGLLYCSVTNE